MLRNALALLASAFIISSATFEAFAEVEFRWHDQTVGRLDFRAPSGANWTREAQGSGFQYNGVERNWLGEPKRMLYLTVLRNSYPGELADWTEQEIADDFRDSEEMGMQAMGVQTGMYSFMSLLRGNEKRSGRTLYTMNMVMRGGRGVGWRLHRQELYLLFPLDHARTREFYVILIGNFCIRKKCTESDLSVANLLPMLDQLKLRDH
jgi:hypothetical protein